MSLTAGETLRLTTTGERVRTLNAETTAERHRRNGIVREYIDRGEKVRAVARAAGISSTTVMDICAFQESES